MAGRSSNRSTSTSSSRSTGNSRRSSRSRKSSSNNQSKDNNIKTKARLVILGNNSEEIIKSKYRNAKHIKNDKLVNNYLPMIWEARTNDNFLQNGDLKIYDIGKVEELGELIKKYKSYVDDNTFFNDRSRDAEITRIEIKMIQDMPITFHLPESGIIVTPKLLEMGKDMGLISDNDYIDDTYYFYLCLKIKAIGEGIRKRKKSKKIIRNKKKKSRRKKK